MPTQPHFAGLVKLPTPRFSVVEQPAKSSWWSETGLMLGILGVVALALLGGLNEPKPTNKNR